MNVKVGVAFVIFLTLCLCCKEHMWSQRKVWCCPIGTKTEIEGKIDWKSIDWKENLKAKLTVKSV